MAMLATAKPELRQPASLPRFTSGGAMSALASEPSVSRIIWLGDGIFPRHVDSGRFRRRGQILGGLGGFPTLVVNRPPASPGLR